MAARVFALAALALLSAVASAQDAARGKELYWNTNGAPLSCGSATCHNGFPALKLNNIAKGTSATSTLNAITNNKGGMGLLNGYVSAQDAADIAAYIANPNVTPPPPAAAAISFSAMSLAFGNQTVGAPSAARTITVSNTGTATLMLSALTLAGADSGDFARAGTCAAGTNLAAGANCSVQITFTPAAAGARSATLTIAHNASGGSSTLNFTGTGVAAAAAVSVTPNPLAFSQTVNAASPAQTVTVANTGTAALTINDVSLSGTSVAEYAIASGTTCTNGASVAAGANCVVRLTFTPAAAGARNATLSITHSATGSPATVALNGMGTVTALPAISLSASTLALGTHAVGLTSAQQSVTVTNSGQATLNLTGVNLTGNHSGDFARSGTCAAGAALPTGGSCEIAVVFAPSASGKRSATIAVTSDASNGTANVALTGTGLQLVVSVSPTSATLQTQVGTASMPTVSTIRNTGKDKLTVSSVSLTGPFTLETGAEACVAAPFTLASGQQCNLYIVFEPQAEGATSGEVVITTNAPNSPARVALTGQADAPAGGSPNPTAAPLNEGSGGCSVGAADQLFDPLLIGMLVIASAVLVRRRVAKKKTSTSL
jgi:hypothetical protein